jgi:2-methylaconitate cis-trans-isomerase PrpF
MTMAEATETIPFTYYRGGTSKALFFHAKDLPPPGKLRDRLLLRLMGSPDPMQIDGMGGTHPVTSKIAVLSPSKRTGVDVDYDFAQCSIRSNHISWEGGCGNISSAVGPWAISQGLVDARSDTIRDAAQGTVKEVKIWMVGLGNLLIAHVPVNEKGRVIEKGQQAIDGAPGTGAAIWMDYKEVGRT